MPKYAAPLLFTLFIHILLTYKIKKSAISKHMVKLIKRSVTAYPKSNKMVMPESKKQILQKSITPKKPKKTYSNKIVHISAHLHYSPIKLPKTWDSWVKNNIYKAFYRMKLLNIIWYQSYGLYSFKHRNNNIICLIYADFSYFMDQ